VIDSIEQMSQYVLIGREQYQVLLDNHLNPGRMWCNLLFSFDDRINIGGGELYTIVGIQKSELPQLWMYRLERTV